MLDNFSYQWDRFRQTQIDSMSGLTDSHNAFVGKTGFLDLHGKSVLDVGCGAGRYMEIAKNMGGNVTGVDASMSVYSAHHNLNDVSLVQADIFNLPFRDNSFDAIFSIGVLHHTKDTKESFMQLPRLLKSGGQLAIWVYPSGNWVTKIYNAVSGFYRIFTTRMPLPLVYWLCHLAVPLYHIKKVWLLGRVVALLFPSSGHHVARWRILDTFDWYTPKYQWKHTYEQVVSWFLEAGLCNITMLGVPVAVKGMKL